jgi:hypothetical protein
MYKKSIMRATESYLYLGLPPRIFSRKDEPRTRNTRPAALTLLTQVELLHGARAPFFFIAMKSFFFESSLYLGLPTRIFSRKDEPQTRNTRPAASVLSSWPARLHVARAALFFELKRNFFFCEHPFFRAPATHLFLKR